MPRLLAASALALVVGTTLVLSELRWFSRQPLVDRLRPYGPGSAQQVSARAGVLSVSSLSEVVGPLARHLGERLAGLLGVSEDLSVRLGRVHSSMDATSFRVHQLGWSAVGFGAGSLLAAALRPPLAVMLLLVVGGAALGFLIVEQQLASQSERWKRRIFLELPVLSEQLGMLLGAGYSLGGALNRLAGRGSGACVQDLAGVCGRIRQGLSEVDALREWAAVADVDALTRLVAVLSLNREAGDLGRLVADEARSIRREVQRELIEQIERRAQQVWIPVTVATLVPGAVLLAVPFLEALRLFSSS
ncbi:MAG: type II secretion system F family protein [Acidimicrobiales bacterium]